VGRIVEATAPCSIEILGEMAGSDTVGLTVALDRRVWCRVETGSAGISIRSKDTLRRIEADDLASLGEGDGRELVALVLRARGLTSGVHVETHGRVPEDTGLAVREAMAVALAAACGGDDLARDEIARVAGRVEAEWGGGGGEGSVAAALFGGAHAVRRLDGKRSAEPLAHDPGRIEECLLLVDAGPAPGPALPEILPDPAREVPTALAAGRYGEVGRMLAGRRPRSGTDPALDGIVAVAEAAGGAAWRCRGGRIVVVWAAPGPRGAGPRETVLHSLAADGLRVFPARVDARGVEVE
jgi:hypothetical protein